MSVFLSSVDVMHTAAAIVGCLLFYILSTSIYRLYLHPLSNHHGPRLWAVSQFPSAFHLLKGQLPYKVSELHKKYGPVIRIAPNELSYNQEEAWQDIYGKPSPRNTELQKDPSQFIGTSTGIYGLLMEPSDVEHARMRRNLSHGFSEKALRDQEPTMTRYFDLLIQRLHENSGKPVDLVKWYNFTTFDVIGDLTFGESFDCLETSTMHFWVGMLFAALKAIVVLGLARKFPPLDRILLALAPKSLRKEEFRHRELTEAKLMKRLSSTEPRTDFLVYAQTQLDKPDGMTYQELFSTVSTMIVAGSETTASLLSGVTYYLLTNPPIFAKLTAEIRNAFKAEGEITMGSVNGLAYTLAVLNEGLRIYPPTPSSLPRMTPPQGCQIAGHFIPGHISVGVSHWAAYHSPSNFKRPEEFVPERWMGDIEFRNDKRKVVNPFSVGPRNCMGRNLAYAEMRVMLARMIWNFDMELCEGSREWNKEQRVYLVYEKPPLMVKLRPAVK